ncbi:MerR family transcriptional regulator [Granulicoccus phenolivorans]|uniref:MerR family transcriptional regulator n=1 Tax=Granulicoccus phenolivorans TaxID=266854 RepID=UPI000415E1F6|nr:MerR family transcriptional regulator [Granulicoccus phenolivorans]
MTDVAIGEFSRLTHLSIKQLRRYHEQQLLAPARVDPVSGYRYYRMDQVPDALLVRRLRDLELGLPAIRDLLSAPDQTRSALLRDHLATLQQRITDTGRAVEELRALLAEPSPLRVELRHLPDQPALIRTAEVAADTIDAWLAQAYAGLYGELTGLPAGPAGARYGDAFFTEAAGPVEAFVPVPTAAGTIPGGAYAIAIHAGPYAELDRTYAALGRYVHDHDLAAPGPIRENYLIGPSDSDPAGWRTEVCWPITPTAAHPPLAP